MPNILTTFLELGDATSRNLEFAHRPDVSVSYGEETITENNLLEIRRRHPHLVYLETFPKLKEAKSGADWEWHIIGRKYTARMRVQAKRVQSNGTLKIRHRVKSSGLQQRDLLLDAAKRDNLKPVYCFYSTESQRSIWNQLNPTEDSEFQTGCLLADARDVSDSTTNLKQIEDKCIPWHYLFNRTVRTVFVRRKYETIEYGSYVFGEWQQYVLAPSTHDRESTAASEFPTIEDLNGQGRRENFDSTGVGETNSEDLERLRSRTRIEDWQERVSYKTHLEMNVHRIMWIDVRNVQRIN